MHFEYDKPRIVSFLSFGMPVHNGLRPSTMSLHSSLASRSVHLAGKRYAKRFRMRSNGDSAGAGGINRTSLERMSPNAGKKLTKCPTVLCLLLLTYRGAAYDSYNLARGSAVVRNRQNIARIPEC